MSDTPDRYYHQLSSTGSYQSISYMGLSDDDDDDEMERQSATTLDNQTSFKESTEDLDNETKPYLEKLLLYKESLLPYRPTTSDDEPVSPLDQFEYDEFELSPAQLELDELESQYMLSDQFEISQYQINKSQTRLKELQEQYEEFQGNLEEPPKGKKSLEDEVPGVPNSSEIHIDLHKAFLKECRNLDGYLTKLEEKEMTKHNIMAMTEYVNKLRDLYMAFLINHIDQKYQILSLKNTIIEKKQDRKMTQDSINKKNKSDCNFFPSANIQPQIEVSEEDHTPSVPTTSSENFTPTKRLNSRKLQMAYTRPYVLILKNTSSDTRKIGFKSQRNAIETELEPKKNKIGIKSIGPTRQGGVVLSFYSESDRRLAHDILKRKMDKINLQVTIPTIIYPKMVIHDIGNHWNVEELKSALITQNREIEEACENGELFDIVFLSKDGEVIIKVSPLIRNHLKQKGRICANLESYKVSDRIFVKRCYKCHQFGHFSSACMYNEQKCGHCNGTHMLSGCPHKDDATKAICVNCTKSKLYKNKANHRPSDPSCPSQLHEQQKTINKTDYGYYGY